MLNNTNNYLRKNYMKSAHLLLVTLLVTGTTSMYSMEKTEKKQRTPKSSPVTQTQNLVAKLSTLSLSTSSPITINIGTKVETPNTSISSSLETTYSPTCHGSRIENNTWVGNNTPKNPNFNVQDGDFFP